MTALPIPLAALEQHIIALGKTRSGKSSKMRVIVEAALDRELPVCIIDPKGDWWGLKSSADGKHPGYPVVIFGGAHGDVPINASSGASVAELVATGNRPCIIDLKGWTVADRTTFFIKFAETFFARSKGRRLLAIDEVHNFAPQTSGRVDPKTGLMLHWANRLASEGSGLGITLISASQRPQKVHKDYVSSHETLIACRVIHKRDRKAYEDWIEACGDDKSGAEVMATVANMKRVEAWVWSPEIDFGPKRITWPLFKTYDSFKPQAAKTHRLKGWAAVNLDDVRDKFATAIEQAKANDPDELKKQIAALKAEKTTLERQVAAAVAAKPAIDPAAIETARQKGFNEAKKKFGPAVDRAFKAALSELTKLVTKHLQEVNVGIVGALEEFRATIPGVDVELTYEPSVPPPAAPQSRPAFTPAKSSVVPKPPAELKHGAANGGGEGGGDIGKGERIVLTAIAQYPDGAAREQLTVLTGYKKSSRDTYIQRLAAAGLVELGAGGEVRATEAGIAALGADFAPLPTGAALQSYWLDRLTGGEQKILGVLIEAYPQAIERSALDEPTGYKKSARDTYIRRLAARKLVAADRGVVRAADILFEAA